MALFPPTESTSRPLTSNTQRVSNIEANLRYPQMGGFRNSNTVGGKSPFKQKPPGDGSYRK